MYVWLWDNALYQFIHDVSLWYRFQISFQCVVRIFGAERKKKRLEVDRTHQMILDLWQFASYLTLCCQFLMSLQYVQVILLMVHWRSRHLYSMKFDGERKKKLLEVNCTYNMIMDLWMGYNSLHQFTSYMALCCWYHIIFLLCYYGT